MAISPGQRLGPYEIHERLGAGGMGEVYRARDTRLDRSVAIKVLTDKLSGDEDSRRRLEVEARAISALSHPNICALHDVGGAAGVEYLVMELLEGETLATRLERGPLSIAEAIGVAQQIASGLDRAHHHGIVHRDLKPGNVMLTRHGVKLLDFGLARFDLGRRTLERHEHEPSASRAVTHAAALTSEGSLLGTLHYMAPEQIEGQSVDSRADVFAFGAVLYEMLTGRRAFEGSSIPAVWSAILRDHPEPISAVVAGAPAGLDLVVRGCLAKDPEARWQSLRDVQLLLANVDGAAPSRPRQGSRRWVGGALAAALGVGILFGLLVPSDPPAALRPVSFELLPPPGVTFVDWIEATSFGLSPDGSHLAFVAASAGASSLYLRPIDSLHASAIPGTEGANSLFWSPDGRRVGFFVDGKLKIAAPFDGDAVVTICEVDRGTGSNGTWGADSILYANIQGTGIYRVKPVAGSVPELLFEPPADGRYIRPWFLPDGRHFLFSSANDNITWSVLFADESRIRHEVTTGALRAIPTAGGALVLARSGHLEVQGFDLARGKLVGTPRTIAPRVRSLRFDRARQLQCRSRWQRRLRGSTARASTDPLRPPGPRDWPTRGTRWVELVRPRPGRQAGGD